MIKQLLTFFFIIFTVALQAQTNLVINPSFEDTVHCPNNSDEINYSYKWDSFGYSPDYFNSCNPQTYVSTPYNFAGYQIAASGNAYAGFISYESSTQVSINYFREYIAQKTISPLIIGTKYFVSFKVSPTLSSLAPSNCVSNNLGATFSNITYSEGNPKPIINNAKINTSAIISDTLNWTRITGSFLADSSYEYIIIGNFFSNINTDTLVLDNSNICKSAYYYLDDVCVSTDSLFATNYIYTGITNYNGQPNIFIYPNPASDKITITSDYIINEYKILDPLGKIQKQGKISVNSPIGVDDLEEGIYILQLDDSYFYKILINR